MTKFKHRDAEQQPVEHRTDDQEGAASNLIFGLLLVSLIGLGTGIYFYLNSQSRVPGLEPNVTNPIPSPLPSPNQPPEV